MEGGKAKRDHLLQVKKQTGKTPSELVMPPFPEVMQYPWEVFTELSGRRQPAYSGIAPITYEQVKAWKDLTQMPLSRNDLDTVMLLDRIFMKVMNNV